MILVVRSVSSRERLGSIVMPWRALFLVLGALLGYLLLLETLGFVPVTLLFLLLLFRFGKTGWTKSGAWAAIATSLAYALFKFWLQVQLPSGPFGL